MEIPVEYLRELFWFLSLLIGGWLLGWVVEHILLRRLSNAAFFQKSLSGLGRWMGLAGGLGIALRFSMLPSEWHSEIVLAWKICSILIITVFLARLVGRYVMDQTAGFSSELPTTSLVQNVLNSVVYTVGFLIILQMLGISVTPVLTALGVGGLAVALALQETLSNLFAGIQIIASRKIRIGDFIRLESGQEGYVTDITWRNTTIGTLPDSTIIVPNAKLASSIVTNTHLPTQEMTAQLDMGVHYDSDLEVVERIAIETTLAVLKAYPSQVADLNVHIYYRAFADSSINFSILFQVPEFSDQEPLMHALIKSLHRRFREAGVQIPYPTRTIDVSRVGQKQISLGPEG